MSTNTCNCNGAQTFWRGNEPPHIYPCPLSRLAVTERERDEARAEIERFRAALDAIANDPHCAYDMSAPHVSDAQHQYKIGIADGHRCAANRARRALEGDE